VRRQLVAELGARGVASLAAQSRGLDTAPWHGSPDPSLIVEPGADRAVYRSQGQRFDAVLAAMKTVWSATESHDHTLTEVQA